MNDILSIFFALTGIVFFSPLIIVISIIIKVTSEGPVFYRGWRVGKGGKLFKIWKFRTMVADAEKTGITATADDDPRIIFPGKFLRKYKLDEIPQLFNVLSGDMSFVGPRPEVKKYTDMFNDEEKLILSVKPGITSPASLWDYDEGEKLKGSTDPEKEYLEKIRPVKTKLELEYVRNKSLLLDFKIIFETIFLFLRKSLFIFIKRGKILHRNR